MRSLLIVVDARSGLVRLETINAIILPQAYLASGAGTRWTGLRVQTNRIVFWRLA